MRMGGSFRTRGWLLACCLAPVIGSVPVGAQTGEPEPFARGVLDLEGRDEYGPVLDPTGSELYLTIRRNRSGREFLARSTMSSGTWSEPVTLGFSGEGYDKEPYLSPDGSLLFFASQRPVPSGEDLGFELWVSERVGGEWSEPRHLSAVGSPGYDNYPAVAANGNLYFGSDRVEERGRIFRSEWSGDGYGEPEMLMAGGSPMTGADPYIDPQERFIIHSSTRQGGFGEGDLYLTMREADGWGASVNLGSVINTTDYEYTPFISPDGEYLYFSRGWGEMWRVRVAEVDALGELPR